MEALPGTVLRSLVYLKSAHELNGDLRAAADTLQMARGLRKKLGSPADAGIAASHMASTTSG